MFNPRKYQSIKFTLYLFIGITLLGLLVNGFNNTARADAGFALSFNGTSNYVSLERTSSILGPEWTGAKTISLWVKPAPGISPAVPPTAGAFILSTDRPRTFGITRATFNNADRIWVWNVDADSIDMIGVDITPGEWQHLAAVFDGVLLRVYKNGSLVGTVNSGPAAPPTPTTDGRLYLGGSGRTDPNAYFAGEIDEVRVWNTALEESAIVAWMELEITTDHPAWNALAAYYKMSDGIGVTLSDNSGLNHSGSLLGGMGDGSWVPSDAFSGADPTPTSTVLEPTNTPNLPTPTLPLPTATQPAPTSTQSLPTEATPTVTPITPAPTSTSTLTSPSPTLPPPTDVPPTATSAPPTATSMTPVPSPSPTATIIVPPAGGDPIEIGFYDTPGGAYDLTKIGNLVTVADTWGGIRFIDVSNPTMPIETGYYDSSGRVYGVTTDGEYIYAVDSLDGLYILDISDPTHPDLIASLPTPGYAWDLTVSGDFVYIADRWGGVRIVNISNPEAPFETGFLPVQDEALDIVIQGNLAFIADYRAGLMIADFSDPYLPVEIGRLDFTHSYGIKVIDQFVYVADGTTGLHIVDASNPAFPIRTAGFDSDGFTRSTWIDGQLAYLADWNAGLYVVDMELGLQVGTYDSPDRARDVIVENGIIYLADYLGGLRILQP